MLLLTQQVYHKTGQYDAGNNNRDIFKGVTMHLLLRPGSFLVLPRLRCLYLVLKNIQVLRVWENIPVNFESTKRVLDFPVSSRGKAKARTIVETSRKATLIDLQGDYRGSIDTEHVTSCLSVKAENYVELQKHLREYIKSFTDILDSKRREVCPHCKGTGICES